MKKKSGGGADAKGGVDKDRLVQELRDRMSGVEPLPGDDFFTRNDTLLRFLKARNWSVEDAEKQLKDTVEWRRKTDPLHVDCRWCHERPGYHSVRQVGVDKLHRPVIYACFSQAACQHTTVEDTVVHITHLIENAKRTMGPNASTWVFVMDCTGMTLTACNPRVGYGITNVMATYYPERLGLVICINHNPIFQGVWNAFKVFLDPNTVAKMQMLRTKSKYRESFRQLFDEDLSNWLMDEIKLNKHRPLLVSQRQFWTKKDASVASVSVFSAALSKMKSFSTRSSSSAESISDIVKRHDPRGCPTYVRDYVQPYLENLEKHDPVQLHSPHPNIVDALRGTLVATTAPPVAVEDEFVVIESDCSSDEESPSDSVAPINIEDLDEEFQVPQHVVEEYKKRQQQEQQ